jgi:hypothetical protein
VNGHIRLPPLPILPLVLGVSDGILNALILAAGAILHGPHGRLSITLAARVGVAACVTAGFTMFVAYYAEARAHLVRSSRQLNLTEPARLAASSLGRSIFNESIFATVVAATASLVGAAFPLLLGTLLPVPPWTTLVLTVGLLGAVGWLIGATLSANRTRWLTVMVIGGAIVTAVGAVLDIA